MNMIFHLPAPLRQSYQSGSTLRPMKVMEAVGEVLTLLWHTNLVINRIGRIPIYALLNYFQQKMRSLLQ